MKSDGYEINVHYKTSNRKKSILSQLYKIITWLDFDMPGISPDNASNSIQLNFELDLHFNIL